MPTYQTLPLALNYWMGNQFVPAPVQWAPRPKPPYADALTAPTATGQPSPAQSALGFDGGYQGGQPSSNAGQGLNAQSGSFGDFARSALTGPVGAFGSFGLQSVSNALSGNPSRAITGLGLMDTARSIAETLGIGGNETAGEFSGPGGRSTGSVDTLGGVSDLDMQAAMDMGGTGANGGADYGPAAQEAAESGGYQGSGMYARGGMVKALIGPNPPGPDDGHGALDRGEYVVRRAAARHYGKGLLDAINEKRVDKAKLKGILSGK